MELKDLKRLLEALAQSGVSEFSLETGDYKLSLRRGALGASPAQAAEALVEAPPLSQNPDPSPVPNPGPSAPSPAPAPAASTLLEVSAPIVGTFYAAPAPDSPDYVKVGDRVEGGQVLCIIEAMKLMNEIEAETAGVVREILVKNEEPVEYGQVLFRLEPA